MIDIENKVSIFWDGGEMQATIINMPRGEGDTLQVRDHLGSEHIINPYCKDLIEIRKLQPHHVCQEVDCFDAPERDQKYCRKHIQ